jgi:AcrR family transcriptional regulator
MAGVRQFDEGAALKKALALFWKRGVEATSMQELAAATGIQRGSLYNAYGSKEALFLRVFELYRARFIERVRVAIDKPRLRDALHAFFEEAINSMTTGFPARSCLSTKTALGASGIDPPIRKALQGMLDELEGVLAQRLAAVEKGVRVSLPPDQAARLIITFTRGLVVIERIYQDKARLQADADLLTSLLLDQQLKR